MTFSYKIFFVGIVVLAVIIGGNFDGVKKTGGVITSVITSADAASAPDDRQSIETAQAAATNDSTTPNDINGDPDALSQNNNVSPEAVLDNSAILKPDLSSAKDAFHPTGSVQSPDTRAEAAIVADLKTGRTYFGLNQNLRWPTAQLAEFVSAATALKNMDLSQPVKTADGKTYSANDTLNIMLGASDDGAAENLANAYGRGKFVSAMNSIADDLGMSSTNFSSPTGMSISDQSTAGDFQKFAMNIYQNYPKVFETTRKKSLTVKEVGSKKKTIIPNTNVFAGDSGFIGGKNGYTNDADGNSLSVFSYSGRPVLAIVLGADDAAGEARRLMDWFENNYK